MAEVRTLPLSRPPNWDWQEYAKCRGLDTSTFYHPENERGPKRVRREMQAKAICATCPVTEACLRWALATREPYGVWGGKSVEEREAMITQQAV
ncbi:MAG: WhiB family transcriptional regulator [Actinobacteria bacterium]|nr:WhiB family transcriptional regulator [Actinomycetota bacterium]